MDLKLPTRSKGLRCPDAAAFVAPVDGVDVDVVMLSIPLPAMQELSADLFDSVPRTAIFISSGDASYMVGTLLSVDGGVVARYNKNGARVGNCEASCRVLMCTELHQYHCKVKPSVQCWIASRLNSVIEMHSSRVIRICGTPTRNFSIR